MADVHLKSEMLHKAEAGKEAAAILATSGARQRDEVLRRIASELRAQQTHILEQNKEDVIRARTMQISDALMDRLSLSPGRVQSMAAAAEDVAALPDVLGEGESWRRPNGLEIRRIRVPLGLVAIVYEARPNVTVEAATIAFKAGNAVLLRGSSSALTSNRALVKLMQGCLPAAGLPTTCIQLVEDPGRSTVDEMVKLNGIIDVVIPRGGADLIQRVINTATVPVIETGIGNCHVYVDTRADLEKARRIIINAKTQRPSVCNAAEKLLVHQDVAPEFLASVIPELRQKGVQVKGCDRTRSVVSDLTPATDADWPVEYLDMVLAVKVVESTDEAIRHINRYGSHHSDAIVTEDYSAAQAFQQRVDSSAVYVNASTRFTDGSEFGFGGEMGISTQKLHARGPMGLRELTTTKYVIMGDGQVRE